MVKKIGNTESGDQSFQVLRNLWIHIYCSSDVFRPIIPECFEFSSSVTPSMTERSKKGMGECANENWDDFGYIITKQLSPPVKLFCHCILLGNLSTDSYGHWVANI